MPVLSIQTREPGQSNVSPNTPIRVAYTAIERAFPGSEDTADLVVERTRTGQPAGELGAAQDRPAGSTDHRRPGRGGDAGLAGRPDRAAPDPDARVEPHGRRQQGETLRDELEPAVASAIPGAHADLTGDYAGNLDFTSRLSHVTPLVIAFVLGLAFILLIATFRSWQLALSVIGLNLLSVGAAFGVLVAVFQHHWAQSLLGFQSDGQVVDWLPLFAFVVLFGLSMDYTVLVLERAREARRRARARNRPRPRRLARPAGPSRAPRS